MKKGFTLVELLAVIIILGIISLITTPIISVQITKSKISAYRINVQNIIDEAKEYATHNTKSNDFPKDGINYKSLGLKIDNIKSGLIKKNELGEIEAIDIYNGKYCASGTKNNIIVKKVSSEKECKTIDYTGPELTLKKVKVTSNSIMINAFGYDSQTEIYSYTFQIGNNTPKEIITNSKVASYEFKNLKSNTEYEITVSVKNKNALSNDSQYKNNKESTTTTRKILVKTLDVGIPTFEISSDGYSKTKQVTINYPSIDGINGYIFDGKDITVNNSKITLDITKNGKIEAYTKYNGEILKNTLNIYGIDDKGPEIISVDNPDTWEMTKVITVVIKDTGSNLTSKACSFDGGKSWINYKKSGNKLICTQVFSENKVIDFKVRDKLGNITDIESFLNGNKIIISKVDRTVPTCTLKITSGTAGLNNWYKSNIVVGINSINDEAVDYNGNIISGSGVVKSEISNNTKEPLKQTATSNLTSITTTVKYDGTYKVTAKVTDKAGNIGTCIINTKRDTVAPSMPSIINPTNGNWTNNNFSLTLSSNDATSGISNYQYSYDNKSWTTYASSNYTTYTTTKFTSERNQAVYIRSCDKAGNCSTSSSSFIRIDKTAPNINVTSSTGTRDNAYYTLTGTVTDNLSGISSVRINNVNVPLTNNSFSKAYTLSGGNNVFTIVASDNAGNSYTKSVSITMLPSGPQSVPNLSAILTKTGDWHDGGAVDGVGGGDYNEYSQSNTSGYNYSRTEGSATAMWTGCTVSVSARYSGTINLTTLPNYQSIKRIVVTKYSGNTQTINVTSPYISVSDSSSDSVRGNGFGTPVSASTTAGITSVKYYYN